MWWVANELLFTLSISTQLKPHALQLNSMVKPPPNNLAAPPPSAYPPRAVALLPDESPPAQTPGSSTGIVHAVPRPPATQSLLKNAAWRIQSSSRRYEAPTLRPYLLFPIAPIPPDRQQYRFPRPRAAAG